MGEMRFVLALSGWTTNDWTTSAALDLMAAAYPCDIEVYQALESRLAESRKATFEELRQSTGAPRDVLLGTLHLLARHGQVVFDFAGDCYRHRRIMPAPFFETVAASEPPELAHGRRIHGEGKVHIAREEGLSGGRRMIAATAEKTECEGILDADGSYTRAKCSCSYFFKNRLRGGPCRHLLAVQLLLKDQSFSSPQSDGGRRH
jgi:hypothetical protein